VLTRRTHVAIEDPDAGVAAAPEVAALVSSVLGWDTTRQKEEVAAYEAQPRLTTII
jgi:glycerol-3-phosphate dehydrogenase